MNLLEVKGRLNVTRGKIIQHLASFIGGEKQFCEGKETELIGRIQQRTGQARRKHARQK
jgi:uncharacterized protein YjbJ (UPF0337 family)